MVFKYFLVGLILVSLGFFYFFFLSRSLFFLDEIAANLSSPFLDSIKAQYFLVFAGFDLFLIMCKVILQNIKFVVTERFLFLFESQSFSDLKTTVVFELLDSLLKGYFLLLFMLR